MLLQLTNGGSAIVDAEDFEILSENRWQRSPSGYATRGTHVGGKPITISMHRVIMNVPDGVNVHHKNNNGLDNRKSNLARCNQSQNAAASKMRVNNTSGYRGVYLDKTIVGPKKWFAAIMVNYRLQYLGSFADKIEAAKEYNRAAIKAFREFANPNPL